MVDRRTEGPPARTAARVTLTLLVLVVVLGGAPLRARAGTLPGAWRGTGGGDGSYTVGNGSHNKNSIANFSPENNHGIQHVTNTTVGGSTNTQASFCKWRFRHCHFKQRIVVGDR
jgi:hypothetical protein